MIRRDPPHPSLGRWISILYRLGQIHLNRALIPHPIGAGQVPFLADLYAADGLAQDALAARLSMDKGTTARALAKLEAAGFVIRRPHPGDRRVKTVHLTDRAWAFQAPLMTILRGWTDTLAAGFTPEERATALSLLERMADNARRSLGASQTC